MVTINKTSEQNRWKITKINRHNEYINSDQNKYIDHKCKLVSKRNKGDIYLMF